MNRLEKILLAVGAAALVGMFLFTIQPERFVLVNGLYRLDRFSGVLSGFDEGTGNFHALEPPEPGSRWRVSYRIEVRGTDVVLLNVLNGRVWKLMHETSPVHFRWHQIPDGEPAK